MPFIANFSKEQIQKGLHFDIWQPTVLIQIQDPDTTEFVSSPLQSKFIEIHQFKFWDDEDDNVENNISENQAEKIAQVLQNCFDNNINIMVHCHAGICRSGAVVEAGSLLGFDIPDGINKRIPNRLVFNKIRKHLGLKFSWE